MPLAAVQPFTTQDFQHHPKVGKDCGEVLYDFATTQMKNIAKAVAYAFGWLSLGLGKEHEGGKIAGEVSSFAGNTKNFLSTMELPAKALEVRKAASELWEKPGADTARNLFLDKIPALVNPTCDALSLTHEFVPLGEAIKVVKGVNFAATFVGAANGAVKDVQQIHALGDEVTEKSTEKTTLYLINLARDISYATLGIIGMLGIVLAVAIAPWMYLACLTSGLTFTIGGFFYERLVVNPNGKHDSPAMVRDNANFFNAQSNHYLAEANRLAAEVNRLQAPGAA